MINHPDKISKGAKERAMIVNFTGFAGHFGMLGTSLAVFEQLLGRGYDISFIDVDALKALPFADTAFCESSNLLKHEAIQALRRKLRGMAIILVNGEGTLHGWRPSSIVLLNFLEWLLTVSESPIFLTNFSCFPDSNGGDGAPEILKKYASVLDGISARGRVIVRDQTSSKILSKIGVKHQRGFDSLPLTIGKHFSHINHQPGDKIIISGGAGMRLNDLRSMSVALEHYANRGAEFIYVSGGTEVFVAADRKHYEVIASVAPRTKFVRCASLAQFLSVLADQTRLLFTGRFHYAIAARSVGTPCLAWSSNTPKTEAISHEIGLRAVLRSESFSYRDCAEALEGIDGPSPALDLTHLKRMGEINYEEIVSVSTRENFHPSTLHVYGQLLERAGVPALG